MHETDALAESVADMRETLDLVRNLLAGVREEHPALARIGDGIGARLATDARTDGSALGPLAWEPRSTQLRDGIDDVLRTQGNAVMLWRTHPQDADTATVTGCLTK